MFFKKAKEIKALKEYNHRLLEENISFNNKIAKLTAKVQKLEKENRGLKKQVVDLRGY